MTRAVIGAIVLALAPGSVRAGDAMELPKGPPPTHVLVSLKDGKLQVKQMLLVPETRYEQRVQKVVQNGKEIQVTVAVPVVVHRPTMRELATAGARVFGTDGKEIEARRLPGLLKKERVALLSGNQQMVEPFYLQTVREGTLILVLPQRGGVAVDVPVPVPLPPPPPPKN